MACNDCGTAKDIDCATCKLAFLKDRKTVAEKKLAERRDNLTADGNDDYSISEQLTKESADYTILYLVLVAFATFALVVLFSRFIF